MASLRFETPLGSCGISWQEDKLTGFSLPPTPEGSGDVPPAWIESIIRDVQSHLGGQMRDFAALPYAWEQVTPFQRDVYIAALGVKPGETWSYGQLTAAIGQPISSARAVGTALGQNPWPLLVPCHRFIGANGRMTGFSSPGGISTKLKLLALEGSQLFAE